jgi:transcription termination factor Rho
MKARFEGMRPGEPMIVDDQGRRISLILRLMPETPEEVADLKKFCRMTEAFTFVIDEDYRDNTAHIAPVYGERAFSVVQRPAYVEETR